MKKMKIFSMLLALVLILGLLCGCGSSKNDYESAAPGYSGGTNGGSTAVAAKPMAPDVAAAEFGGWAEDTAYSTAEAPMTGSGLPTNVKIIYTADVSMESTEFDATVRAISELVSAMGGYYERNSLENYGSGYRYGYYTVRVPAERFDTFCDGVSGLCQVTNISRNAQDVSEAYYDVESRLTTQQTKLERLQELLKKAEDMEDIITLESAISETELVIEQLTGSLRRYDSLVGYSTINMNLREVYKLSEQEQPAIGFGAKLAAAFRSGSRRFVRGLEDLFLSIAGAWIGWLIFLIFVAVVVIIPVRIVRKRRKNRQQPSNEE